MVYDPAQTLDAMHSALFARKGVRRFRATHLGRGMQAHFDQMGILVPLVTAVARDALNEVDNPRVRIKTRLNGADSIAVEIEDNGMGMEASVREHIFDPFFSTKPVGSGTGLGLSICWTIVKNHHGMIQAESSHGKGTIISIVLPLTPEEGIGKSV